MAPTPPISPTAISKQDKLLNELIDTENTYVTNLHSIVEFYIKPLKTSYESYNLKQIQISTIFMNLEQIYQFHSMLYAELQGIRHCENRVQKMCKIILKYSDFMKMYTIYVNGYSNCLSTLTELNDNKKFQKFCTENTSKTSNLNLQSLLILPVQRIPRYEMLLKELKNTIAKLMLTLKGKLLQSADTDVHALDESLSKIQSIALYVNEKQRKFEQQLILNNIECKLEQCNNDIKKTLFHSDDNILIKECEIYKNAYIKKLRKVYVFTKYLLVCDKLIFKACLTLKHMDITLDTENECAFSVQHPSHKLLSFCCNTAAERTQLITLLQKQIEFSQHMNDDTDLRSQIQSNVYRQSLSNLHSITTRIETDTNPPTPQSRNSMTNNILRDMTNQYSSSEDTEKPVVQTPKKAVQNLSSIVESPQIPQPITTETPTVDKPTIDTTAEATALQHSLTHKISSPIKFKNLSIDSNISVYSNISVDSQRTNDTIQLQSTLLPESYLAHCTHEMSQISSNQLTELKHLVRPVQPVKLAIESIAILLNLPIDVQHKKSKDDMYWKTVQSILVKPNFLQLLLEFNKKRQPLNTEQVKLLKSYIHNPLLAVHTVSNANKPVGTVWRWIRAYYAVMTGDELPVDMSSHSRQNSATLRKSLTRNNSITTPVSTIYRAPKMIASPSAASLSRSPSTKSVVDTRSTAIKRPTTSIPSRPSLSSVKPIQITHARNNSNTSLRNGMNSRQSISNGISSISETSSIPKPRRATIMNKSILTDENVKPNLFRVSSTSSNASTSSTRSSVSIQPKTNKAAELRAAKTRMSISSKSTIDNGASIGPKVLKASSSTKSVLNSLSINGTGITR